MTISVSSCPPDFSQGFAFVQPNWKAGDQVARVTQSIGVWAQNWDSAENGSGVDGN